MDSEPITRNFELEKKQVEDLYTEAYAELRRLAAYYMKQERTDHTLQPTALVHEAYLRLVRQREVNNYTRTQFIALAANMMRRILINHAIRRKRQKREGLVTRVALENAAGVAEEHELDLFALDEALQTLAKIDKRQERIFELRFFGGLSVEETAEVMELSPATVKNEWAFARAWLRRAMKGK